MNGTRSHGRAQRERGECQWDDLSIADSKGVVVCSLRGHARGAMRHSERAEGGKTGQEDHKTHLEALWSSGGTRQTEATKVR